MPYYFALIHRTKVNCINLHPMQELVFLLEKNVLKNINEKQLNHVATRQ